jgi:hypothetical protein
MNVAAYPVTKTRTIYVKTQWSHDTSCDPPRYYAAHATGRRIRLRKATCGLLSDFRPHLSTLVQDVDRNWYMNCSSENYIYEFFFFVVGKFNTKLINLQADNRWRSYLSPMAT